MKTLLFRIHIRLLFFLLICITSLTVKSQNFRLKVAGNEINGYAIEIFNNDERVLLNDGEFSIQLFNLDLSCHSTIDSWTGSKWIGDENRITITRDTYLKDFDTQLSVEVSYELINDFVIKKAVNLFQPSIPALYFILKESFQPAATPKKYITFEHDRFPGGFVHELYPSAGFITSDNMLVGFLSDAGYKNHFTRTTRRRFSDNGGGFVGMRKLPDPNLLSIATPDEQKNNIQYIKYTFGEFLNLDCGEEVAFDLPHTITPKGDVFIERKDNIISMECNSTELAGMEMITPFENQNIYTISFFCKGNASLSLKLYRIKNGIRTEELEHGIKYIDNFPVKSDEWTEFKGSVLVPYLEGDSIQVFIGTNSGSKSKLEIKELQFTEHKPKSEPFNFMPMGLNVEKTTFIFIEPWKSHRDFVISSQIRLAEGKSFKGSASEKMLYANLQMNTWITSINDFTPFNVPNMNYAPDMYNRDSFWSITSTYHKKLNLEIWNQWAKTQTPKGAIGTIITPYMGSVEAKDNEATIDWLIWALLNKRRFNVDLPEEKIEKAINYVLNEFDDDGDGKCKSHFSMSQVDVINYEPKTDRLAVNQGMLAVALRTIKELGYTIEESYIEKAEAEYRNFYDIESKHLLFDKNYPELISLTDLIPEFLSLWLFDRPLLTDEMVNNHLEQIPLLNKVEGSPHPEFGTTAPICVRLSNNAKGYAYMSSDYQPFGEFGENNYRDGSRDGYYYNGGSWLRAEYCAYVTGLKHGWPKAEKMMENRLWAEFNLNPNWPYSKEFIPTQYISTVSWWNSTRGLCWNAFVLMANELAGKRTPEMDPDYVKQ